MKLLFKSFVLALIALNVIWFLLHYFDFFYSPEFLEEIFSLKRLILISGSGLKQIYLVYLLILAAISLGLFYFKNWARMAFLGLTLLSLPFSTKAGISFYPASEYVLLQSMRLIEGALLALMYLSNIKIEFSNSHNNRMQPDAATLRR